MYIPPKIKPLCPPEFPPRYEDVPFADVLFDDGTPHTLKIDIYQSPTQTEPGPTIIYIFGGGFLWGEYKQVTQKAVYFRDLVRLTQQGYTIVSADYRLASQDIFPACIHDVKGLVRFLKANGKKYKIDPERIGVLGNSAGGHLASMLALSADDVTIEGEVGGNLEQSSSVKAAAIFYGTSDLNKMLEESATSNLSLQSLEGTEVDVIGNEQAALIPAIIVGYSGEGRSIRQLYEVQQSGDELHPDWRYIETLRRSSPLSYVYKDCPPMLLLHGGRDRVVNPDHTELLYKALSDVGADVTMVKVASGGHGPSLGEEIDQIAYSFLTSRI